MTISKRGKKYIERNKIVEKLSIDLKNGEGVEHALNKILEIGTSYSILKRHHIKRLLKFDDPNTLELAKKVKAYIHELRYRKREKKASKASKKAQLEQDQVEDLDDVVQQDEPAASGSSSNADAGKNSEQQRKRKSDDDLLASETKAPKTEELVSSSSVPATSSNSHVLSVAQKTLPVLVRGPAPSTNADDFKRRKDPVKIFAGKKKTTVANKPMNPQLLDKKEILQKELEEKKKKEAEDKERFEKLRLRIEERKKTSKAVRCPQILTKAHTASEVKTQGKKVVYAADCHNDAVLIPIKRENERKSQQKIVRENSTASGTSTAPRKIG